MFNALVEDEGLGDLLLDEDCEDFETKMKMVDDETATDFFSELEKQGLIIFNK